MIFTKAHNLSQLHDEILAQYPDLKGVLRVEGREMVEGKESDNFIRLTLPEGVSDPGLAALVAAHVQKPTPLDVVTKAKGRLKEWADDENGPPITRKIVLDIIQALRA